MLRHILRILGILVLAGLAAGGAWAQTGSIGGTVTDQSGAVVPGVDLTLTEVERKLSRSTKTDAGGNYLFTSLPPGNYEIRAERAGFKTFVQSGLTLEVDQRTRLDVVLQVGAVGETVSVTAELPLVSSENINFGGVVENRRILEMPLNGRFFLDLANLLPGTVHSSNPRTFLAGGTAAGSFAFNTAGSREDSINYLVEGINLNDMVQNQITFQPNIEFIQEFKIQASSFSAELGRSSGAVVNAVMRSGTNRLHGDAYEFLRNDVLDARNFFDPPRAVAKQRTGRELPPFKRNIFGAAVGGPIWIPGVYDGHDRSFFFATYEGRRQRESETFRARVPTAAEPPSPTPLSATCWACFRPRIRHCPITLWTPPPSLAPSTRPPARWTTACGRVIIWPSPTCSSATVAWSLPTSAPTTFPASATSGPRVANSSPSMNRTCSARAR